MTHTLEETIAANRRIIDELSAVKLPKELKKECSSTYSLNYMGKRWCPASIECSFKRYNKHILVGEGDCEVFMYGCR